MQKIKRKDLKQIYNIVCDSWKEKIKDALLWKDGDSIEVEDNIIEKGYNEADTSQKKVISKYFKIINNEITGFDDILRLSGTTLTKFLKYKNPENPEQVKANAFDKIQLIKKVLNKGWEEDWENSSQYKYFPYFQLGSGGWCFCLSRSRDSGSAAVVAFYKDQTTSDFAGKIFLKEYIEYIIGKLQS
jgi:hypothetical protein